MKQYQTIIIITGLCLITLSAMAQVKSIAALQRQLNLTTNPSEKYTLLSQLDGYYMQTGHLDSMETLHKQLLGIAQKLHSDSLLAQTYIIIGNYLSFKSDFEISLEFYFKALHLAEEKKLDHIFVTSLNNIGGVYEDLENFGEASKYMRRALKLISVMPKKGVLPVYLNWHLAFDNYNTGQLKEALHYQAIATRLNKKDTAPFAYDFFIQGHILWLDALLAGQMGNNAIADIKYQKAIAYSDSLKMNTPLCFSLNSYSKFMFGQKRYGEAKKTALRALSIAQSAGFPLEVIKAAGILSKTYTQLHQPDSSNYYYQVKDSFQEKVFSRQRLNRLQDITFTEQIRQQEEQAKQADLEAQRHHNLQYAGIATALITFIVIFLVISRKADKWPRLIEFLGVIGLLILFEFVNLLLHPFIGKFTHESPLLMLLIMVIIAAMMVPLHHKMEGLIKHKLLKKDH